MTLTICEKTGKPIYETTEDINHPVDYTFESINNFVHAPDVNYEELQCCCLGMATEIEKLKEKLVEYRTWIDETYENRSVFCEPPKE